MLYAELNRTRRLGAEFEMTVPRVGLGTGNDVQQSIANCLTANGVRAVARPYQHTPVPDGQDITVEYDSSVRGESLYRGVSWHSVEIKTRVLQGIPDWETVVLQTPAICRHQIGLTR